MNNLLLHKETFFIFFFMVFMEMAFREIFAKETFLIMNVFSYALRFI